MLDKGKYNWPNKYNIFGVGVSGTNYDDMADVVVQAASEGISSCISHIPVHGLILGATDPGFREILNSFEIVAPDGMPVKIALNNLYKTNLNDRVYGPEFMLRVCDRAADEGIGIYLYGSYPDVIDKLRKNLLMRFPSLRIVGYESPPFRELSRDEDNSLMRRINSSCAQIAFIGLGCPKQDIFAYKHKNKIKAVQICVGAAFDFLSGNKKMAPSWMQKRSLEWLFRLSQEPKRLWKRYFLTNSIFLWYFFLQLTGLKKFKY